MVQDTVVELTQEIAKCVDFLKQVNKNLEKPQKRTRGKGPVKETQKDCQTKKPKLLR